MPPVVSPDVPSVAAESKLSTPGRRSHAVFVLLAFQNLLRRPVRTSMLMISVAIGTAAIFASFIITRGIEASMQRSFSRMGADLIVVPESAMVNITSALLTVQPTDARIDSQLIGKIAKLEGVAQVSPQTIFRVPMMAGMPECKSNLIGFDPKSDFTVMPWLDEHAAREMRSSDLLCGGRRTDAIGDELQISGKPANVYGKLGRSGVGPFDESIFATYETVAALTSNRANPGNDAVPLLHGDSGETSGVSAVLVRLGFGATPEQVKFAISRFPGVKVVTGARIVTSTRQTVTALLGGLLCFIALVLVASQVLVGLLFCAIIGERRREIGLLRAIGSRRGHVVGMLTTEAGFVTGFGGLLGVLLGAAMLLAFQRSLVYYLETLHVEFAWPGPVEIGVAAFACAACAGVVGVVGALFPAVRASREQASVLINNEGC